MPNQDDSPKPPGSLGVIRPDWDNFVLVNSAKLPMDSPEAMRFTEVVYYTAALLTYNRIMMSLREHPIVAAAITAVMRDELNRFFDGDPPAPMSMH